MWVRGTQGGNTNSYVVLVKLEKPQEFFSNCSNAYCIEILSPSFSWESLYRQPVSFLAAWPDKVEEQEFLHHLKTWRNTMCGWGDGLERVKVSRA